MSGRFGSCKMYYMQNETEYLFPAECQFGGVWEVRNIRAPALKYPFQPQKELAYRTNLGVIWISRKAGSLDLSLPKDFMNKRIELVHCDEAAPYRGMRLDGHCRNSLYRKLTKMLCCILGTRNKEEAFWSVRECQECCLCRTQR